MAQYPRGDYHSAIIIYYASSYARNILPRLVRVMSKRKRSYDTATKLQEVEVAEKKSKERTSASINACLE